jgi:hypothetical protein
MSYPKPLPDPDNDFFDEDEEDEDFYDDDED